MCLQQTSLDYLLLNRHSVSQIQRLLYLSCSVESARIADFAFRSEIHYAEGGKRLFAIKVCSESLLGKLLEYFSLFLNLVNEEENLHEN